MSRACRRRARSSRHRHARSRSRRSSCRTRSRGSTSSPSRRPARARRSRSRCRSSSERPPATARPSALVLVPTRELAAQVTEELEPLGEGRRASRVAAVYGGVPLHAQAKRAQGRARPRRDAGPARGSRRAPARRRSTGSASSSSTRPTGCSTWASSRRSTASSAACRANRQTMFFSATLDGEVGELARAYTSSPSRVEARAARRARAGRDRAPLRLGHGRHQGRDARRAHSRADVTRRSSSSARSAAPTGSCTKLARHGRQGGRDARRHVAERTRERALGRFESGKVDDARRDRRRRPRPRPRRHHARDQLRPARRTTRATSTASAAPAAPGADGNGITFVLPEQQADVEPRRAAASATASSSSARACASHRSARLHEPE